MKKIQKIQVGLLFGGRSTEHDVSLKSAAGVLANIDRDAYDVSVFKITRQGEWRFLPGLPPLPGPDILDAEQGIRVLPGGPAERGFIPLSGSAAPGPPISVDILFPVLHGTFGEDGTVQGALAMSGIPLAGAGVAASAVGMDKVLMKQLFFQNDLPGTDYLWFTRTSWRENRNSVLSGIAAEIGFPCFVKPSSGGSSVGISKVKDPDTLIEAVDTAARYDRKVLVEKAVNGRELECAVLGNDNPRASGAGEIMPKNDFYDYDAKYLSDSRLIVPASVPPELERKIQTLSIAAFKAVDCAGLARVDFLYDQKEDRLYVNEINTLPGFTPISMYPKLWEAAGVPFTALISSIIGFGLERNAELQQTEFNLQV